MKKVFIFIISLLSAVGYAQTYKNGTWYSLYDESEHTMNTQGDYETGNVFAPTAGTLNVQWRYEWLDWLGIARKIDTKVLESANGGSNTNQVGALAENTGKNSNTTEKFTVSPNINWIKFNREGMPTHKVIVYHIDMPLAKHILLASGDYGTTSASYDFGDQDVLTTSEAYTINLRSFLTAGDITVRSSDPEIFHLGSPDNTGELKYAVGANACASANGKAASASGGTLGKIANYAVPVYFTPKVSKNYGAVITLTDGVSTVTVSVIGVGRPLEQTITWEPATSVLTTDTLPVAVVSSGLEPAYAFAPEDVLAYTDGALQILGEGTVTVTVSQEGNAIYAAAEPVVRTITVFPALTRSEYSAAICEGEQYSDEHFQGLTASDRYYDTIPNAYGGDSVICLALTVNPVYLIEQNDTIHKGDVATWQEIDLSEMPVGDTTLIVRYSAVTGCDSVYALQLTVTPAPTYGKDTIYICGRGEVAFYDDVPYSKPNKKPVTVTLSTPNQFGGDSIVELWVLASNKYDMSFTKTIEEGTEEEWQGIDLSVLPAGDTTLVVIYTTIHGCDSTYTLHLTVKAVQQTPTALDNTDGVDNQPCKFFRNGQMYIRKNGQVYNLQGIKVEER